LKHGIIRGSNAKKSRNFSQNNNIYCIFIILCGSFTSSGKFFAIFIALIMSIFNPIVTKLAKKSVPRGLSILAIYLLMFLGASFAIGAIIPPLIEQTSSFVNNFPRFLANLGISTVVSDQITEQFIAQLGSVPSQVAKATVSFFSNVLALIAVLVFAFYLLAERNKLIDQLGSYLGEDKEELVRIADNIELRLGGWARESRSYACCWFYKFYDLNS
jgi:predicted PurR-regulated permease PerM